MKVEDLMRQSATIFVENSQDRATSILWIDIFGSIKCAMDSFHIHANRETLTCKSCYLFFTITK